MTRPIYEPTPARSDASLQFGVDQLFRRPGAAPPHYPICFRAAMGQVADPENDRVHYITDDDPNVVYWDYWDTEYNPAVYDTTDYEQTVLGIPVISGVGLLQIGIYSIHAQIDFQTFTNITYQIGSNFDEGQVTFGATNNIAVVSEPFYGDNYLPRVDHWRQVVSLPPPDTLWGGEATDVQITFSFSGTTAMPGVTPGVWDGANPDPAGELWIPGGTADGAWGYMPNMLVMYWGPTDNDPNWPFSIEGTL